jgi:glycosyltransferase involved in cell wall biosynthesis
MNQKLRIGLVVSHPIQHFCPQYASFAKSEVVSLRVFFASALGHQRYFDENFKKELAWDNLYLDQFDHRFLNGQQVLVPSSKLDAPTLNLELKLFKPDLLIVYGYYQKLQRRAYRWAKSNKIKLAYISDSETHQKRNILKEFFKRIYLSYYFSKIDYFLTVGNSNEEYYRLHGISQEKLIRMHFPIDLVSYERNFLIRSTLRQEIRRKYAIGENELVLLVVGKLVSWKNQDHIIDSLIELEKEGLFGHLLVVGSGEMEERWRVKSSVLKKSKVHFVGFVTPEMLPAFYAAADIYVHSAQIEPHSIAISEAIYMELPVIVSDRCGSFGQSDDVQEGKNGFVYPFGEIRALAEKIKA